MNSRRISKTKSIEVDIVVIGGGGCCMAAAVAAAEKGVKRPWENSKIDRNREIILTIPTEDQVRAWRCLFLFYALEAGCRAGP